MNIGNYFPDRSQLPLSAEEQQIVDRFHDLYYRRWTAGAGDTINLSWFGYQLLKCPLDLWIYQELLVRRRPDMVIETGTCLGGSALYIAMLFDMIGHGRIVSIDIDAAPIRPRPQHPRITYLTGSSTSPEVVAEVKRMVGAQRVMVSLDSDHREPHVYDEIIAYSPLVQVGDYLIVEDGNVNGHPTFPEFGPGPTEAVRRFLSHDSDFEIDESAQRFMMTLNPNGYLRRVRSTAS